MLVIETIRLETRTLSRVLAFFESRAGYKTAEDRTSIIQYRNATVGLGAVIDRAGSDTYDIYLIRQAGFVHSRNNPRRFVNKFKKYCVRNGIKILSKSGLEECC
jgi:hypothetical protein